MFSPAWGKGIIFGKLRLGKSEGGIFAAKDTTRYQGRVEDTVLGSYKPSNSGRTSHRIAGTSLTTEEEGKPNA